MQELKVGSELQKGLKITALSCQSGIAIAVTPNVKYIYFEYVGGVPHYVHQCKNYNELVSKFADSLSMHYI